MRFRLHLERSRTGKSRPGFTLLEPLTDGHVEGLTDDELQDMRHWANLADRPDWTLASLPRP